MRPAQPLEPELFTLAFWKDTAERVVSSAAGGALASIPIAGDVDFKSLLTGAGVTALVSLLKALVASQVHPEQESASLVDLPGKHAADQ